MTTAIPQIPSVTIPDQFNVASYFLDRNLAEGRGNNVAIYFQGQTYTYAQIAELANRVGNGLRNLGVEIEQRVALILLDSPEFAAALFGTIKIGAVPVPLNTLLKPADYLHLLNDSRAKVLFLHANLWEKVRDILPQLPYLRRVIVVGLEGSATATIHDFAHWTQQASPNLAAVEMSKDDSAFWLYSSGSTGFPKGCVHLQHDMIYCLEYYAKPFLGLSEKDICFSAAKSFFAYGFGNGLYFPFGVGASAVHHPGKTTPEEILSVVDRYRPTLFFGSPALFAKILALPDAKERCDFSSVRLCVSAGEALPADILRRWQDQFHVDILDGIGSTEILHIFISNRSGDIKPGSSGKLVPGYEAQVLDESGLPVTPGKAGSLLIRGESTAACYWNKHEKTKSVIQGHWIVTGDTYVQDAEGYFWYGGRADDMLKVSGQWLSPTEVEGVLITHQAVLQAAVIGVPDQDKLIKPKAYIVLQQGFEPTETLVEELKTLVKQQLAPFKSPYWVEFLPELPMTATGKIQRYILREGCAGV